MGTSLATGVSGLNLNFLNGAGRQGGALPATTGAAPAPATTGVEQARGPGVGDGLASLVLPNTLSPSMKSIFAAAVELPIVTALAAPLWSRRLGFAAAFGVAEGLYAAVLSEISGAGASGTRSTART